MKRIGYFIIIFGCLLTVAYMAPVLQEKNEKTTQVRVDSQAPVKVPADKNKLPKADKWAKLINQPVSDIPKKIGKVTDSVTYANGAQSLVYGNDGANLIEIKLDKEQLIKQIFILGRDVTSKNMKIDMTLSDISEKIVLSDQVEFAVAETNYQIDLTGNDLNTKPLVLFNNHSLGMIHLDQETGQTLGISYFSTDQLVAEQPYQQLVDESVKPQKPLRENEAVKKFQERIINQTMLVSLEREASAVVAFDQSLNKLGMDLLTKLKEIPDQIILDTHKLNQWKIKQDSQKNAGYAHLSDDELSRLYELTNTTDSKTHALVITPMGDVNLFVMALFAGEFGQHPLNFATDQLGIAINDGMAVLVYQEQ